MSASEWESFVMTAFQETGSMDWMPPDVYKLPNGKPISLMWTFPGLNDNEGK